jgi:hypothetical protein
MSAKLGRLMMVVVSGLGVGGSLAGCTQFEPFQRQGTWHQNDAPMQNIAIELADPHDLYRGRGDAAMTGQMAQSAIDGSPAALAAGAGGSVAGAATGAATGSSSGSGGSAGSSGVGMGGGSGASTGSIGSTGGGTM